MAKKITSRNAKWSIFLSDKSGGRYWPIAYRGNDKAEARRAFLKSAKLQRLPAGSHIEGGGLDKTK